MFIYTPNGGGTTAVNTLFGGRLYVPPAYLQTSGDTESTLKSSTDSVALQFTPDVDLSLSSLSLRIRTVTTTGAITLSLCADKADTPGTEIAALGTISDTLTANTWFRKTFTAQQLQRGVTYWIVVTGADGASYGVSYRRTNTNLGSATPDTVVCKSSQDGGTTWTVLWQNLTTRSACLNLVLNSTANHVPQLWYGRCCGDSVYLPGSSHMDIPQAGVSLNCEALVSGTVYNVYLYDVAGTMTLEAATTVTTTNEGYEVKTGETSRLFVGMIAPWELITGFQGPQNVSDSRCVWNQYNHQRTVITKPCPYSAYTLISSLVHSTWYKWMNNDDWQTRRVGRASRALIHIKGDVYASATNIYPCLAFSFDGTTVQEPTIQTDELCREHYGYSPALWGGLMFTNGLSNVWPMVYHTWTGGTAGQIFILSGKTEPTSCFTLQIEQ